MKEVLGTLIVAGVLLVIVAAILAGMINKKKKGESGCGCGCSGCGSSHICHPQDEHKN